MCVHHNETADFIYLALQNAWDFNLLKFYITQSDVGRYQADCQNRTVLFDFLTYPDAFICNHIVVQNCFQTFSLKANGRLIVYLIFT